MPGVSARQGAAPDPRAVRRNRKDDPPWLRLPDSGLQGDIPEWPVEIKERPSVAEQALWDRFWRERPQAHVWKATGQEYALALYIRNLLIAMDPAAPISLLSSLSRMKDSLLLTPLALRSARLIISLPADATPEIQRPGDSDGTVVPFLKSNQSVVDRFKSKSKDENQDEDED